MTSRERVLKALNHEIPDRVPIDLGGNQTGIHKNAYRALIDHLGIRREDRDHGRRPAARPAERARPRAVPRGHALRRGRARPSPGRAASSRPSGTAGSGTTSPTSSASAGRCPTTRTSTWTSPSIRWPKRRSATSPTTPGRRATIPSRFAGLRERALRIRNETPYAVVSGISGVIYENGWYLRGLEQWFCDLLTAPEFCEAVLDQMLKYWLDWFRLFLDEAGDVVDVIMIGDDLAGQDGPLFSPEIYRRLVKPRQKRLVQYIRSRTRAKIWYHTCGACVAHIPDLIDNGIDILNPVQIGREEHGPARTEAPLRRAISPSGAADANPSASCPAGPPPTSRRTSRRNLAALMPGGGYVFTGVHNIQGEVPPENIVALFDAAYAYGKY